VSDVRDRVTELLASLGSTADEVAEALRARGITGTRDDGCACPIARIIVAELAEARDGRWGDSTGEWFVTGGYVRTPAGDVKPPAVVAEFIDYFDNGIGDPWSGPTERPYSDLEDDE
jgi:hypothetical protein